MDRASGIHFTLPEDEDAPSGVPEAFEICVIAVHIAFEFR